VSAGGTPGRRRRAVALEYERGRDRAPRVSATGAGPVGERILEAAREHGIPIRRDPDLAEALAQLDLWQSVPPELYAVIAEVFAWAYRANGAWAERGA
jgi:flagellar biosynthesis protein